MSKLLDDLQRIQSADLTMANRLHTARERLASAKAALEVASGDVQDSEANEMALVVLTMTDPPADGLKPTALKPMFPNKESREAEVHRRLKDSRRHQGLVSAERTALGAKGSAERELLRLEDEDRSIDRQLNAVSAALRAETLGDLRTCLMELTLLDAKRQAQALKEGSHA